MARHRRDDALGDRRLRAYRIVERQRAVEDSAVIWPRSAILHSAAASRVEGIFGVTVSTADRIATRGGRCRARAPGRWRSGRCRPCRQRGRDVDRRVGDEQRLRIARHVHDEDVADAARRAQAVSRFTTARISSSVCRLPFISASALPARASATAVFAAAWLCSVDDLEAGEVDLRRFGGVADFRFRSDQHRLDQLLARRFDRADQRSFVDGWTTAVRSGGKPRASSSSRR